VFCFAALGFGSQANRGGFAWIIRDMRYWTLERLGCIPTQSVGTIYERGQPSGGEPFST
jgi:hypothetical protein